MEKFFSPDKIIRTDSKRSDSSTPDTHFTKFVSREKARNDIYEASKNLADYMESESIPSVMFLDNSARQAYVGLKEIWKKEYPDQKRPDIYFINPEWIEDESDFSAFEDEFNNSYKNLNRSEPILLYDVCIHTGRTIFNLKNFFEHMGFKDVRIGISSVDKNFPKEDRGKLDLVCLPHGAALGCNPFGKPAYIDDDDGHLVSKAVHNNHCSSQGKLEHQKIKEVFREDKLSA